MTNWTKEELKMLNTMKDNMDFEDIAILLPNKNASDIKSKLADVSNPVSKSTGKFSDAYYNTILEWVSSEEKPFSVLDFIKDNNNLAKDLSSITKVFQELDESNIIHKVEFNPNKYVTDSIVQNKVLKFLKKNRGQYFTTGPIYNNSGRYVPYMKLISILETMVESGKISKGIIKTNSLGYKFGKETVIPSKETVTQCNDNVSTNVPKRTFMQKVKRLIHYLTK